MADEKRPTAERIDKELEEFRDLMQVPDTFQDGFTWSSLIGALFVGILMVPGAVYMSLLVGQGIGPAAQWVTIILFIEVAKRAQKSLNRAEVFVLFYMSAAAMGMPFQGLLWNQFYMRSEAATAYGIAPGIPNWFAPDADSVSYGMRTFFHHDWMPAVALVIFVAVFSQLANMVLGYGLFRLASDVEKLPFPMAPIGAMGIIALVEDFEEKEEKDKQASWRWRVFSVGGAFGMIFGGVYLLLPILSGAFTGTPITILPIPFVDFTTMTEDFLPAVAMAFSWDLAQLVFGMVMPFWGMVGSFLGLLFTVIMNPILQNMGFLNLWSEGDNFVQTIFNNDIDFYFSFGIGIAVAIALVGFYEVFRNVRKGLAAKKNREGVSGMDWSASVPEGRGDIPNWAIILCYFVVTTIYIVICGILIDWHRGVMIVLLLLGFVYTPIISYVTARLEGLIGQVVEIPYIKEASLIASGYNGVAVWFLPIPVANYGQMTMYYRQAELTGTKFTSLWKTQIILFPIILVSSIVFMNFIWSLNEVPSAAYPYANVMWELQAAKNSIIFSATLEGEYSLFEEAFKPHLVGLGAGFGLLLFVGLTYAGAPVFLVYGVVRGLGQSTPEAIILQFIGALIGRYYFQRRLGLVWRQYILVVAAGFSCGVGLIATVGIGITFLHKAAVSLPF